ncbi:MAG: porin [Candidatus Kapaibacterium sp.]
MRIVTLLLCAVILSVPSYSQQASEQKQPEKKWFEKISLRGYTQVRYNRLLETNPSLKCEQCDRSIGENGGFFIRRARLVFSGQVSDNVFIYIQPDFASTSGDLHFAQLRDAYFDLSIDSLREFRFRVGQSKIPFGYENLQSSQNRLPLDRADGTNSALPNERDLGVLFYWAPAATRKLYSDLISKGLKGSGDYGVFGFGVYNGQTANKPEGNNDPHVVARLSYPVELGDQILEPGIQAYTGKIAPLSATTGVVKSAEYLDERMAVSISLAPKPIGLLAEYNWGHGPRFMAAKDTTEKNRIESSGLEGGFATLYYKLDVAGQHFLPYARVQYYKGGKKQELDARYYDMKELEIGMEWQVFSSFELTAAYAMSERTTSDAAKISNNQKGNFLRLQAQFNY